MMENIVDKPPTSPKGRNHAQCSTEDFEKLLQVALKQAVGDIVQQVGEKLRAEIEDALCKSSWNNTQMNKTHDSSHDGQAPALSSANLLWVSREMSDMREDSSEFKERTKIKKPASRQAGVLGDVPEVLADPDFTLLLGDDDMLLSPESNPPKVGWAPLQEFRESMRYFVASPIFGYGAGILVLLNCFFMGVETNIRAMSEGHLSASWKHAIQTEELIFCILFTAELSCRICAYGSRFFSVDTWLWNMFDSFIVTIQVLDQVITAMRKSSKFGVLKITRMLRLLRLFRIMRIARVLYLFEALGTLVISISKSMSAIVWAISLMLVIIYAFAVLFTELASDIPNAFEDQALQYWFGSVPRTILTLLESIMGGVSWDEPIVTLMNNVGVFAALFFCFYISMGLFVMLNVVTGVFVDKTIRTASEEADIRTAAAISHAFSEGEEAPPLDVTWKDFEQKLEDPALIDFFNLLNVDKEEAQILFELIDKDGSGTVDADEIVTACMHLKGGAKAFDVAKLHKRQEHLHEKVDVHIMNVDAHLKELAAKMGLDMTKLSGTDVRSPRGNGQGRGRSERFKL